MSIFSSRRLTLAVGLALASSLGVAAPPSTPDTIRFLEQATWGPRDSLVKRVQALGFNAYLREQFGAVPTLYPSYPGVALRKQDVCPAGSPATCSRDNFTQYPNQLAFFQHALTGPDQLRQRVGFALHEILVTSGVKLSQPGYLGPYLNLLLRDAFGNYRQVLQDITLSPAMGKYLDMVNNRKPSADGKVTPNENYGREVLQLFAVGLNWLNPDGTLRRDSAGQVIPVYDQDSVEGFAHVFTGWTYADPGTSIASRFPNVANFANPMVLYRDTRGQDAQHDKGPKRLLALTPGGPPVVLPANQDGLADLGAALDNIFSHPNVGVFIGKQLIQHLVTSNPSPAYVKRVSVAFDSGYSGADKAFGSGRRGDLKAVVAAILLDPEARAASTAASGDFGHLREPVQYVLNVVRALDATSDANLMGPVSAMGQKLFYPPSVFSYYPHEFTAPEPRSKARSSASMTAAMRSPG